MVDIYLIIPCYNLENYIGRCLKSIISQRYDKRRYELMIVLDFCTDSTYKIASKLLYDNGLLYKIIKVNVRCAGLARNVGLGEADGKYIWFVDGDDYVVDDNAFLKLVTCIKNNNVSAVYMPNVETENVIHDDLAAWRFLYSREIIGDTRFGDKKMNEDWEFTSKIRNKKEYSEEIIPDTLYHYTFPREGSLMDVYFKDLRDKIKTRR